MNKVGKYIQSMYKISIIIISSLSYQRNIILIPNYIRLGIFQQLFCILYFRVLLREAEPKHHMAHSLLMSGFQWRKCIVPFNRLNYTASDFERWHPGTLFDGKHLCSLLICSPPPVPPSALGLAGGAGGRLPPSIRRPARKSANFISPAKYKTFSCARSVSKSRQ